MVELDLLERWWTELDDEQRRRAREIAQRPAPRGMVIDSLVASMTLAGIPTARQIWTGQPEFLAEMLDEVAEFVKKKS